ncbi:uncharacterized protein SCDLUD_003521 [Saccharomycodes ludwigii]|uniref:uncharacterized protein n=1 Tax=Saccharomycodes ludwigii TaxID=36035 RepID=UPI001E865FD7|nr:hypothetical protein SCDLUD_003521 [Saccharomycodes ludwigii]KAH3900534.1 hypothetical protein SCDLUD_003521 [Saccharomycodes ludwigii]
MTPKTAIITGAAQGIGRSIALRLATKGFQIGIADLEQQRGKAGEVINEIKKIYATDSLSAKGPLLPPVFYPVDVSDKSSVVEMVDAIASKFDNHLDVMINNAGIASISKLLDCTPEQLDKVMKINVGGVLNGIQAASEVFVKYNRNGSYEPYENGNKIVGKIINCCSIAGNEAFPILPLYSASKFAVKSLTQSAAKELAPLGITCNAYAPGIVLTKMWDHIDEEMHKVNGLPIGENLKKSIESIALKRGETPEDISGLVAFLAGDESDYITGQNISVDGGICYN